MYSAIMTQILLRHNDYQKLNNDHISAHRIYDKKESLKENLCPSQRFLTNH